MESRGSSIEDADFLLAGTADWVADLDEASIGDRAGTTRHAETVEGALEIQRDDSLDCIVTGFDLADGTGVELVERVRSETTTLPVVLCTTRGDESIASDAIAAGVTDYVPLSSSTAPGSERFVERIDAAVREGKRERTRRDRVRQFDAVFHDGRTMTWVLDPAGRLERINQRARDAIGRDADDLVGERFETLPWWPDEQVEADVRRVLQRASDDAVTRELVTRATTGDDVGTIEFTVRPVQSPRGGVNALVVDGVDITERVSLHRDLRRSERLHRVTLNNMTDTVLVTDDGGAFTYVCPNVHFIFGYTAEEIHDLGSIDALLGEDLVDGEELASEGVLTNIECVATDEAGREHTLLVNVREVDIQGGTRLYSCRDVTKRKQREEALRTLQTTTRDLLYAETREEIARTVTAETSDVLDLEASALYLFRDEQNVLEPVGYTGSMEVQHGPLHSHGTEDETIVGHAFLENERRFFDDVREADLLYNQATALRSAAYIPLGDHGVYVVGASEPGTFDSLRRELADLVAATAEAALDRVERESRLREQDRELQRRNERLTELDEMNELIRGIDRALVQADTTEEIDSAVCDTLTDGDRFAFAWIGEVDAIDGQIRPRAWAGDEDGYLDSVDLSTDDDASEPAVRTATGGAHTLVSNVAADLRDEAWRKAAVSRGYQSVVSVPLAADEFTHGVLTVYASTPGAVDDEATVMAELGETVAAAISALERKEALLSTSVTRLEFETRDASFGLLDLARRAGCALSVTGGVQRTSESVSLFASVEDGTAEEVRSAAEALVGVEEVRSLGGGANGDVVRLSLSRPFFPVKLAEHGATLQRIDVEDDAASIVVDVPTSTDTRQVSDYVREELDEVELVAKRSEERTPTRALYATFLDRLTDRQLEVVRAAYYGGYFESPRDSTGEEIAEILDISAPAFYRHTRTVQKKLFSTLFDDVGVQGELPA